MKNFILFILFIFSFNVVNAQWENTGVSIYTLTPETNPSMPTNLEIKSDSLAVVKKLNGESVTIVLGEVWGGVTDDGFPTTIFYGNKNRYVLATVKYPRGRRLIFYDLKIKCFWTFKFKRDDETRTIDD